MSTYRYRAETGGWRFVVLFHHGRKWIRLLDTATLQVYCLPVSALRSLRPYDIRSKSMARRLIERRARFRRLGLHFPRRAVNDAIAGLKKEAG